MLLDLGIDLIGSIGIDKRFPLAGETEFEF